MIDVGIVGGTGYTGVELLRLLARHSHARIRCVSSRGEAGTPVGDYFPGLRGYVDAVFEQPDVAALGKCDVVFYATPNGIAMEGARPILDAGARIVDLSADFRLKDLAVWSHWYGLTHASPDLVEEAVYGLPEVNREQVRGARLVANPGCYPTAVQLGLLPLVEGGHVDTTSLIADVKSGVSGAGRKASVATLFGEASDSMKAYNVSGHRHKPEIEQGLSIAHGAPVQLTFVPHLTPMIRGIHATIYARLNDPGMDLQTLFEARFASEPFVDVMPAGSHPDTRSVRGSNLCRIAVHRAPGSDLAVVLAVEDNLVKGAAGQAIQNMNIMFGFDEREGLDVVPLVP
jgi:N-acetyl-gamma-glutamyl-phosphate reductase